MSNNIYAAPESDLQNAVGDDTKAAFYVVSETKFLIMFLTTFGIYSIYWFYKNWNNYRHSSGENCWPVPRGIFAIFFVHSLFRHIARKNALQEHRVNWNHESQAGLIVFLLLARNILDRLAQKSMGSPWTDILLIVLLFPLALSLKKAQSAINTACNDPDGASNAKFGLANFIWIGLGIILWALLFIGMFVDA